MGGGSACEGASKSCRHRGPDATPPAVSTSIIIAAGPAPVASASSPNAASNAESTGAGAAAADDFAAAAAADARRDLSAQEEDEGSNEKDGRKRIEGYDLQQELPGASRNKTMRIYRKKLLQA